MNDDELIEDLLDENLSDAAQAIALARLRADVELQRSLVRAAHLRRALRQAVRDRIANQKHDVQTNDAVTARTKRPHRIKPARGRRSLWLPILMAAAALMVVAVGLQWLQQVASPVVESSDGVATVDGRPLRNDTVLAAGVRIEVETGSIRLRTKDGSNITLNAGTVVRIAGGDRVLDLDEGSLTAVVQQQQPGQHFVIANQRMTVQVVGTAFTLRDTGDRTRLQVKEGTVLVRTSDGTNHTIKAGQNFLRRDEILGWRSNDSGEDVVRLARDENLRHEGRSSMVWSYDPQLKGPNGDQIHRSFTCAGRTQVRLWLYIDNCDQKAALGFQVGGKGGKWSMHNIRLNQQPLRTWFPIDVQLLKPLKGADTNQATDQYDPAQIRYFCLVPFGGSSRVHVDFAPD